MFDGVKAGLAAMREQGLPLAVVTNKPTEFTLPLLGAPAWRGFFRLVVCGDTCARPSPTPTRCCMPATGSASRRPRRSPSAIRSTTPWPPQGLAPAVLAVPYGYNEGMDVRSLDVDGYS